MWSIFCLLDIFSHSLMKTVWAFIKIKLRVWRVVPFFQVYAASFKMPCRINYIRPFTLECVITGNCLKSAVLWSIPLCNLSKSVLLYGWMDEWFVWIFQINPNMWMKRNFSDNSSNTEVWRHHSSTSRLCSNTINLTEHGKGW